MRVLLPYVLVWGLLGCGGGEEKPKADQNLPLEHEAKKSPPSAETVAEAYLVADFGERFRHVQDGAKLREEMGKYYESFGENKVRKPRVLRTEKVTANSVVVVFSVPGEEGEPYRIYVRKAGESWLVDWPATVGKNPISLKTFRADPPKDPVTLRVVAQLSDYYNYEYADGKDSYYSVELEDRAGDRIHGYAPKDKDLGKKIFKLLQDGKKHEITVEVQAGSTGSIAHILALASQTWFLEK
jgi:hypothetical protein